MKTATFFIYLVSFKKILYWKLLTKTTNEETKMSGKTEISFDFTRF